MAKEMLLPKMTTRPSIEPRDRGCRANSHLCLDGGDFGAGRLCSFSVVFGYLSAYLSVTNLPVPELR